MSDEFDPTPYTRAPILDVASGIALGIALISAVPKGAPDDIRKSAKKLRKAVVTLQDAWKASSGPAGPTDKRPADQAVDTAWAALYGRVESYAWLPPQHWPRAPRAQQILARVFPKGLAFLQLSYEAEWAESEKRLGWIDEEKLAEEIDTIAGPEFLAEVRRAHAHYGKALGITKAAENRAAANLVDPLRALSRAIVQYALKLVAIAGDSPASLQMARDALRPIDEHRTAAARRAGAGAKGEEGKEEPTTTPATPVPDVPGSSDTEKID